MLDFKDFLEGVDAHKVNLAALNHNSELLVLLANQLSSILQFFNLGLGHKQLLVIICDFPSFEDFLITGLLQELVR